ncbi:hypothetical protein [Streptomyces sp. MBT53]|uniref:hypothetical protein n=1 Tax=Streptomyces sp. MBT53 TaxID=1488384 RepID=UPI0019128283|nr:hypothetical protein [Streptomyces sp. MBT53]MBK6012078.1 hypothetical protein [Streptomyces sp. MBT53]
MFGAQDGTGQGAGRGGTAADCARRPLVGPPFHRERDRAPYGPQQRVGRARTVTRIRPGAPGMAKACGSGRR